jgi:hypothetical protein
VQGGNEAATSQGGAVFLTSSKAQMAQCEVIGNTAKYGLNARGGGICMYSSSTLTVTDGNLEGNRAEGA